MNSLSSSSWVESCKIKQHIVKTKESDRIVIFYKYTFKKLNCMNTDSLKILRMSMYLGQFILHVGEYIEEPSYSIPQSAVCQGQLVQGTGTLQTTTTQGTTYHTSPTDWIKINSTTKHNEYFNRQVTNFLLQQSDI